MSKEQTELVLLYGPPAAGKLTVAKKLTQITGFKLFHNHLSTNLVTSIFDFNDLVTEKLTLSFRTQMLEAACQAKLNGIVSTLVYVHPDSEYFARRIIQSIENNGGKVCLVQLCCDTEVLLKRVGNASRKKYGKLIDYNVLSRELRQKDFMQPIPNSHSLRIDTDHLAPDKVSEQIIQHYNLQRRLDN
ncbi:MAG: AAA family ATPase [bacterium]|nr:AAA family ATPase [bacterium]